MNIFAATGPHISIAPETIFHVGPIAITNAQILGALGSLILIWILFATVRAVRQGSRSRGAHAVLWLFENLYDLSLIHI